jgi:hypothetical protein
MKFLLIHLATAVALSASPMLAWCHSPPAPAGPAAGDAAAGARSSPRRIEGLWDEQVVQVDCRTGYPIRPIGRGTNLFVRGGALVATNNAPPTVMGIALGQWWYAGGRGTRFHARMRLNLFQPPLETFLGFRDIHREIMLSGGGDRLTGTVHTQDYFPEGAPNGAPICARETGTRIGPT